MDLRAEPPHLKLCWVASPLPQGSIHITVIKTGLNRMAQYDLADQYKQLFFNKSDKFYQW